MSRIRLDELWGYVTAEDLSPLKNPTMVTTLAVVDREDVRVVSDIFLACWLHWSIWWKWMGWRMMCFLQRAHGGVVDTFGVTSRDFFLWHEFLLRENTLVLNIRCLALAVALRRCHSHVPFMYYLLLHQRCKITLTNYFSGFHSCLRHNNPTLPQENHSRCHLLPKATLPSPPSTPPPQQVSQLVGFQIWNDSGGPPRQECWFFRHSGVLRGRSGTFRQCQFLRAAVFGSVVGVIHILDHFCYFYKTIPILKYCDILFICR